MGQLRIAGGGGSVEYRASNTTGPQILQAPDASGTIALLPSGSNGAYLARNVDASPAERTAAGAITFSSNISVGGTSTFTGLTTHAGGCDVTGITTITYDNGVTTDTSLHVDAIYNEPVKNPQPFRVDVDFNNQPIDGNLFVFGLGFVKNIDPDNPPNSVTGLSLGTGFKDIPKSIPVIGLDLGVENQTDDDGNLVDNYNIYAGGSAPSYFNGGIQFDLTHSQNQSTEKLKLQAYERGVWSPLFTCPGLIFGSHQLSAGIYERIGNMCFVQGRLQTGNITVDSDPSAPDPSGEQVSIKGLPFLAEEDSGSRGALSISYRSSFVEYPVSGWIAPTEPRRAEIDLFKDNGTGATTTLNGTDLTIPGGGKNTLYFTIFYTVEA